MSKEKEEETNKYENVIHKDSFNKNFLPIYDNANAIDYYDIIISIDSFENLLTGWEMKYSMKGFEQYDSQKDKKSCVVGIVGNANKGKTFILQQLIGIQLPTGYSVKTEGLSLKYPLFEQQNVILLDSAGLETPLKNNGNYTLDKSKSEEEQLKDISSIARDKQLTELFLQQFVIQHSNILILVVGLLTYSDQKLLNRIKRDLNNTDKKLFVIHNMFPFVTIEQVEEYIKEVLMKSLTFKLETQIMQNLNQNKSSEQSKNENTKYFVEIRNETQQNNSKPSSIVHFIMANESSEAGEYYNKSTINQLKQQCICFTDIKPFPIIEKLTMFLEGMSSKIMETPILIQHELDCLEKSIKLKRNTIELKRCLVDELGFSNFFGYNITPPYSHYIEDKQFVIEFEMPGEVKKLVVKVQTLNENLLFTITGEKVLNPMINGSQNEFYSNQEVGLFDLEILIPHDEIQLKTKKTTKSTCKDGLISIYFELQEKLENDEQSITFNN